MRPAPRRWCGLQLFAVVASAAQIGARRLSETDVTDAAGLEAAVADTSVSSITLAPGTYTLSKTLRIVRSLTIAAAVNGTAVIEGTFDEWTSMITVGEPLSSSWSNVVRLEGMNITKGSRLLLRAGELILNDMNFYGMKGEDGGAIKSYPSNSCYDTVAADASCRPVLRMNRCHLFNNRAEWNAVVGGSLHTSYTTAFLEDCQIYDNVADKQSSGSPRTFQIGGGVSVGTGSVVTMTRCDVFGNAAEYGGGIFVNSQKKYTDLPTLTMIQCNVYNNRARMSGGGMEVTNGDVLLQDGTRFYNNELTSGSGTNNMLVVGGDAYYKLPGPPGYWMPNGECRVNREAVSALRRPARGRPAARCTFVHLLSDVCSSPCLCRMVCSAILTWTVLVAIAITKLVQRFRTRRSVLPQPPSWAMVLFARLPPSYNLATGSDRRVFSGKQFSHSPGSPSWRTSHVRLPPRARPRTRSLPAMSLVLTGTTICGSIPAERALV